MSETRELGGIFGIISIVGLLWSGSNLFGTMATVFDRFYGAPDRSFVIQRAVSFAMMAVYAVLITVSVASSSITGLLVGISEDVLPFDIPYFAFAIGWLVSVALGDPDVPGAVPVRAKRPHSRSGTSGRARCWPACRSCS